MKPLEGIKIVDLTTFLAAPTASRLLGGWGAEVIKVEAPKGDPCRTQGAVFNTPYTDEENLGFDISNLNKKFITLNLKSEEGMQVIHELLADADVFITSTRTKSLMKLGLDYDILKKKYPKLVFAQVIGFGENGPQKDAAGFDVTAYMSRGGVFGTTLEKGGSPMIPPNGYGDFQVSFCLTSGICAALLKREKTGTGDKVTVSLHHVAVFMMNVAMISAQYGNKYPKSRKEVVNPFNNTYRTKDERWMVICLPEFDRDYNKVMKAIGRKDLCNHPEYSNCDNINAKGLNEEFIKIMDEAFATNTLDYWMKLFKSNDMPCEACYTPLDIYEDEEVWSNDILRKIQYPSGAKRMIPTNPVKFESIGNSELKISRPQGSDTIEVLEGLDYGKEEISNLISKGAVEGKKSLKDNA